MPSIRQRFHLSPCSDFRSHFFLSMRVKPNTYGKLICVLSLPEDRMELALCSTLPLLTRVSIKTPCMQMILPHRTEVPGLRFSTTGKMHPDRTYNALQSFDCSIRRRWLPKRVQARDAKSYLVDGGWKLIEVRPSVELACGTAASPPTGTATMTRPRSRSRRCSPGPSSWPRSL